MGRTCFRKVEFLLAEIRHQSKQRDEAAKNGTHDVKIRNGKSWHAGQTASRQDKLRGWSSKPKKLLSANSCIVQSAVQREHRLGVRWDRD